MAEYNTKNLPTENLPLPIWPLIRDRHMYRLPDTLYDLLLATARLQFRLGTGWRALVIPPRSIRDVAVVDLAEGVGLVPTAPPLPAKRLGEKSTHESLQRRQATADDAHVRLDLGPYECFSGGVW